jgi:hypothetical protein
MVRNFPVLPEHFRIVQEMFDGRFVMIVLKVIIVQLELLFQKNVQEDHTLTKRKQRRFQSVKRVWPVTYVLSQLLPILKNVGEEITLCRVLINAKRVMQVFTVLMMQLVV